MAVTKVSVSTSSTLGQLEGDIVAKVKVTKTETNIYIRSGLNDTEWKKLRKMIDAELSKKRRSFMINRYEMKNGIGARPAKTSGRKPGSKNRSTSESAKDDRVIVGRRYGEIVPGGRNPDPDEQQGKSVSVRTVKPNGMRYKPRYR